MNNMNDKGSLSVESVFDTLLRMGLVMQMAVLTVTIMLTLVIVFLLNVGFGIIIGKAGLAGPVGFASALGLFVTSDSTQQAVVNATQQAIQGWLKWNP